ncbi:hypothetical protein MD484_g3703, partial [Candolleomyces efflorescens]
MRGMHLPDEDVEAEGWDRLRAVLELDSRLDHVLNPPAGPAFKSRDAFIDDANAASKNMKQGQDFPKLLVFKDTHRFPQRGHVSDTKAEPSFIAAFEEHWYESKTNEQPTPVPTTATIEPDNKKHVIWPCIRLAGEDASKSNTKRGQEQHAATYLDLLLVARPDFRGGFGLLLTETHMVIMVAVGGSPSILHFPFSWTGDYARRAGHALVYRLYDPGRWLDPEIQSEEAEGQTNACGETSARMDQSQGVATPTAGERVFISDYSYVYGSCTFGTRTHVFIHRPSSKSPNDIKPARRAPKVVKLQLCRRNIRFSEVDILHKIHLNGGIPGVVRLACHERLPSIVPDREQFRLGLEQEGIPFMSIKTPLQMLMVAYDALETTRILHDECDILHRDISKGNVLFVPPSTVPDFRSPVSMSGEKSGPSVDTDESPPSPSATISAQDDAALAETSNRNSGSAVDESSPLHGKFAQEELSSGSNDSVNAAPPLREEKGPKEGTKYAFIASLLGHSRDVRETSTLIIDFNRSEDLGGEPRNENHALDRTGTPIFIARALQEGRPMPLANTGTVLANMPKAHPSYQTQFPERCEQFHMCEEDQLVVKRDSRTSRDFRHTLHHDAESIFWLIFYWTLMACPAAKAKDESEKAAELIPSHVWTPLQSVQGRNGLVKGAMIQQCDIHPSYQSLFLLAEEMLSFLIVDPHWLSADDPRSHPRYIHECFQRAIFTFVSDHLKDEFMYCQTSDIGRRIREESTTPSLSVTSSEARFAVPLLPDVPKAVPRHAPTVLPYPVTFVIGRRARRAENEDEVGVFHLYKDFWH